MFILLNRTVDDFVDFIAFLETTMYELSENGKLIRNNQSKILTFLKHLGRIVHIDLEFKIWNSIWLLC